MNEKMNIFITGGSSGMGMSLALAYAKLGHQVAVCGRRDEKDLGDIFKKMNIKYYQVDVVQLDQLEIALNDFISRYQTIDLGIAAAGISSGKKTRLPNFERYREMMSINVVGVINFFDIVSRFMLKQKSGHLVAIASVSGLNALPAVAGYSASKAAVIRLCEGLSVDLAKDNITVTCLLPGWVKTPLIAINHHPMPFLLDLDQATALMMRAIKLKKKYYAFPWPMALITKALSILPRNLYCKLVSKFFNFGL